MRPRVLAAALLVVPPGIQAQSAGVLLGFAPGAAGIDSTGAPRMTGYETLWIVRDSAIALQAQMPDLLVPRPTGFWRVGVSTLCARVQKEGLTGADRLWATEIGRNPRVTLPAYCDEPSDTASPPVPAASDSAANDAMSGDSANRTARRPADCIRDAVSITFVSPNVITYRSSRGQAERCAPSTARPAEHAHVTALGSDSTLKPDVVLGSRGDTTLARSLQRANGGACSRPVTDQLPELYIRRGHGRWVATAYAPSPTVGCERDLEMGHAILPAVTGHDRLPVPWPTIRRAFPSASDAFASPRGDLLAIRADGALHFHAVTAGVLGERLTSVAIGTRQIVMIQWALGPNVPRWDREIRDMLRRGLKPPREVVARAR